MKRGLILEGGAMRGMFTAGVMDVLMEHSVCFDGAVGVSAGAAFGCNYKSKQIGRGARYNLKYCRDPRYCGLRSLLKSGNLYSVDFCYGEVPLKLDPFDLETFRKNPMEFYVVCTDVESGEAVYHLYDGTEPSGFDWIRASASMPLAAKIVEIDQRKLLDGGMSDSIPVRFLEERGYRHNVAILTQPQGYRKKKNQMLPLLRICYRKYPKLVEALANRHEMYNRELDEIAEREKAGELFVFRPEKALAIGRFERNPENLRRVYQEGRALAEKQLPSLLAYLEKA